MIIEFWYWWENVSLLWEPFGDLARLLVTLSEFISFMFHTVIIFPQFNTTAVIQFLFPLFLLPWYSLNNILRISLISIGLWLCLLYSFSLRTYLQDCHYKICRSVESQNKQLVNITCLLRVLIIYTHIVLALFISSFLPPFHVFGSFWPSLDFFLTVLMHNLHVFSILVANVIVVFIIFVFLHICRL
jgi:hypothetical protein